MELSSDLLYRIASWKGAIPGWPNDGGDLESYARYGPLIDSIETLPVAVKRDRGWQFGDTYFGLYLYRKPPAEYYEGLGLYVALSRFAPIGIYGEERRAWRANGGYAGRPDLQNAFCVSDPDWRRIAMQVHQLLEGHSVYVPTIAELARPVDFALPEVFMRSANLGTSQVFDIIFNDLY